MNGTPYALTPDRTLVAGRLRLAVTVTPQEVTKMTEPYWSDGQVALYLGDCREILPALSTSEVHTERPTRLAAGKTFCACGQPWPCARARIPADCIVADPPYGETSLAWDRWPEGWLDVGRDGRPVAVVLRVAAAVHGPAGRVHREPGGSSARTS